MPGGVHERIGDLRSQSLLQLQASREHLDRTRELREPRHTAVGDIGKMHLAIKRKQVVLAQRVELNIALDDHIVGVDGKRRGQMLRCRLVHASTYFSIHAPHALRRLEQPFALNIFPHALEQKANSLLDFLLVDHVWFPSFRKQQKRARRRVGSWGIL